MASHLSLPLGECLRKTTNRQYQAWMRHLRDQWNEPDRHDWYVMQLAAIQLKGKRASDMAIPFVFKSKDSEKETVEEATARSKAAWVARRKKIRTTSPEPAKVGPTVPKRSGRGR